MNIISMAGKGSSGKSTIAAFIAKLVSENARDSNVLLVDADPHMVLTKLLNVTANETVGSLRSQYDRQIRSGRGLDKEETREEFVDRQIGEQAIIHLPHYDLLPMGHYELAGCQCTVNRVVHNTLDNILNQYDLVIIDNEAGIEHIGRYANMMIDLLIMVALPDPLFFDVASQILHRSHEVNRSINHIQFIVNRMSSDDYQDVAQLHTLANEISNCDINVMLPESPDMKKLIRNQRDIFSLPKTDPWYIELLSSLQDMPVIRDYLNTISVEKGVYYAQ